MTDRDNTYHLNDNDHGIIGVVVKVQTHNADIDTVQVTVAPPEMPKSIRQRIEEMFFQIPETYDLIEAIDKQAAETQGDADCHAIMEGDQP